MSAQIDDYTREMSCVYKGRSYYVRDNGAIYRQRNEGGRKHRLDEEWTFGKFNPDTGYMLIGQERVHRIVCTAYHGDPVGDRNIVDHIDTNRCNNRPENLRWVTRLENILLNPITRAKVELICGSIEAFLENPHLLYGHESVNPNFSWMRSVTKQEAQQTLKHFIEWSTNTIEKRKPIGKGIDEWVFSKEEIEEARQWNGGVLIPDYKSWSVFKQEIEEKNRRIIEAEHSLKESLTPGALQLNWKIPSEFPLCPTKHSSSPLQDYLENLKPNLVFCKNEVYESFLFKADISDDGNILAVIASSDGVKGGFGYVLSKITYEDGHYIHENIHSYFEEIGAVKHFTLLLGREWTGGDVFDDFC